MGVNAPRIEIDPAIVTARLRQSPAVAADLAHISLGTLTELIGTFVAPPARLAAVSEPYRAVTDDRPIIEYRVASRLVEHRIPAQLFDPSAVALWCPRCFVNGVPAAEVSKLPTYLTALAEIYREPWFLQKWSVHPRPARPFASRSIPSR